VRAQEDGFKDSQGRERGQHHADGTVSYNMGLERTGISTHAPKATTSSKGFILKRMVKPHTFLFLAWHFFSIAG
jgi:hypothetical protein